MDEVLAGAIIAVWHTDDVAAERWFKAIHSATTAENSENGNWAPTRERLIDQAQEDGVPAVTVAAFLDYLDGFAPDPLTVVRGLAEMMASGDLLAAYAEFSATAFLAEGCEERNAE